MEATKIKECKEKAKALVDQMTLEEAASQLRFDAPAIPRLGIPAYNWWNEALHGVARAGAATVFPQAIALAAMFDTKGTGGHCRYYFHRSAGKIQCRFLGG